MKKFALALSFLALPLATVPALTSCNTEPDYIKQARKLEEEQKKNDDVLIQDYLTRNSITNYTRLTSGIYLIPMEEGPTSNPLIKAGNKVTTKYIGSFIGKDNEGLVFAASSDNRTACGCITFFANQPTPEAPAGYQQAVLNMRKGDRKLVLIPSFYAYGANGYKDVLPNTPLLFDVEILEAE